MNKSHTAFVALLAIVFAVFPFNATFAATNISNNTPITPSVRAYVLPPQNIGDTSATLNGSYTLVTATSATVWFQFGTSSTSLTHTTSPVVMTAPNGQFSFPLTALTPGTTYYYRAYASYNGEIVMSPSYLTFTTTGGSQSGTVQIATLPPTSLNSNSVTLNAYINVPSSSYTLVFKWGTNGNLSHAESYGNVSGAGQKSSSISGLTSSTSYSYKACVVDSQNVETCGVTVPFTTLAGSTPTYQCNDGIDNDADGYVDYPNDTGCSSYTDDTENTNGDGGCSGCCNNCNNTEPSVTTDSADSIEYDSAILNGHVDPNGDSVTRWFEYGTQAYNLNETTYLSGSQSSSGDFSRRITGLDQNRTYYFRACAENSYGDDCGSTRSFQTDENNSHNTNYNNTYSNYVPYTAPAQSPTVIYQNVTHVSGVSGEKVSLTLDTAFDNAYTGDTIDYTLSYKNLTSSNLRNAVIYIEFPKDIEFRNATDGVYSENDNTLTIDLGTLSAHKQGKVAFSARVNSSAKYKETLSTKATLAFTSNTNAQEDAVAFATTKVADYQKNNASVLGASAIWGDGSFLPHTLVAWLLLIVLVFIIIALSRYYKHTQVKA